MLVQRWVTPGAVVLVILTSGISAVPNAALMAAATAQLTSHCAHGDSGCIGVLSIGCQVASRSVAGLSSISPLRIAVTGRQKSYWYLLSNTAMPASAAATATSAMKRAQSITLISFAFANCRTIGSALCGPVMSQKRASSVCRADRLMLVLAPRSFISL